jgi:hypothetical protein
VSQESNQQPTAELRIKSAADLEQAVISEDIGTRLAVLKAVGENPQAALRYGKHNGRDLIDVMIDQVNTLNNSSLRMVVLSVLALLPGERVKQAMIKEFHLSNNAECIKASAKRLAQEEPEERRRIFTPFLMQDESPVKAREAAKALADLDELNQAERLRVALVGPDAEFAMPELNPENWELWQTALTGLHAEYARQLVQRQGREAFQELKARWPELDLDSRVWLLRWGVVEFALESVELVSLALEQGPDELALIALECVPSYDQASGLFNRAVEKWAGHEDRRIRRAAIAAGAQVDLAGLARSESDEEIRLAAINRLGYDAEHAGFLAGLLSDDSWRVRAMASQVLGRMGEDGVEEARKVLENGGQQAKTAAVQALLAMGQDDWLKDYFKDARA